MIGRPSLASSRTPEEPMAFTRDEFLGGVARTWSLFVALVVAGLVLPLFVRAWGSPIPELGVILFMAGAAALICGAIAAAALLALAPLVELLARGLRREPRPAIHLVAYLLVGAVIGAIAAALAEFIGRGYPGLAALVGTAALISVPVAWWITARAALRRDRGILPRRARRPRSDVDALAEDTALN